MLGKQLHKLGVPPKFLFILQQLHNGMQARVLMGGLQSDPFKVNVGVKQGCILAPVLFNLFLSPITCLFCRAMKHRDDVHLEYCLDGSLFNIRRLQAHTKTTTCQIHELQYADDCAVLAHSPDSMQHALDTISNLYQSFGRRSWLSAPPTPLYLPASMSMGAHSALYTNSLIFTYHQSQQTALLTAKYSRINKASSVFG